jgi:hypothetical protein
MSSSPRQQASFMDRAEDAAGVALDPAARLAHTLEAALTTEAGRVTEQGFADFLEAQRRLGLTHGQRPLCRHLSPFLLSSASYHAIARAAETIAAALERVAARALVDPAMADELGLSADERALAAIDPGYPQTLAVGRFDTLIEGPGLPCRFIELNADSPAGITDQLLVERTLMSLPHVRAARAGAGPAAAWTPAPHLGILRALREIYAAWSGGATGAPRPTGAPSIALVDWTTGDTAAELRVLAEIFRVAGHPTCIADPGELRYRSGRLSAGGQAIDLVYRRVIVQELVARGGLDHPLIAAYRDRAVCVANSFRTKSINKKASFAVLSDPAFGDLFTPEQRARIADHIPWTRRVRPGPASWPERSRSSSPRSTSPPSVDMFELLRAHRDELVLKPNDEYGGKGVMLGWRTTPAAWDEALAGAAARRLIAQARTPIGTVRMPTFDAGAPDGVGHQRLYFDICPFVFAGRAEGAMVRLSSAPVSNVSAGGGVSGLLLAGAPGAERPDV